MIHPDTRLQEISPDVGMGVVATRPIPAGTLIWVRDALDTCLDSAAFQALPDQLARQFTQHAYLDGNDSWLMTWDITRYMNHDCNYNCVVTNWGFEIACRDIAIGEQLTNDYALFRLDESETFDCRCGSPNCRGFVDSEEISFYRALNDRRLEKALLLVTSVAQPLWPLLHAWQIPLISERQTREG